MRTYARYALSIGAAAVLLAGCGGSQPPLGAPGAMPQGSAIVAHADRGAVPSYLYVADASTQQPAIIAFDTAGNKVAEKRFKSGGPVDVVTDSRGHVYAIVFNKSYDSSVFEYTHNLDRQLAEYHPTGFSTTMTIDAADNLYVQSESAGGTQENIVRYRYGSTQIDHVYPIIEGPPNTMLGISVRGKSLYTLIAYVESEPSSLIIRCPIDGAGHCDSYDFSFYPFCGFTTTAHDYVNAPTSYDYEEILYFPIRKDFQSHRHSMTLPTGYGFNDQGGCLFHSYGAYVWVPLMSDSAPAEAAEIDLHRKEVIRTIGAGYLDTPQAAYYGNGFTP
jgi:hypothetical protein